MVDSGKSDLRWILRLVIPRVLLDGTECSMISWCPGSISLRASFHREGGSDSSLSVECKFEQQSILSDPKVFSPTI